MYKTLFAVGFLNIIHAFFHVLHFLQSFILFKASIEDHDCSQHQGDFIEGLIHNPYLSFVWAILGFVTLYLGYKDYIHHKSCKK